MVNSHLVQGTIYRQCIHFTCVTRSESCAGGKTRLILYTRAHKNESSAGKCSGGGRVRGGGCRKTKGRVDLGFFFSLSLSQLRCRYVVTHFVDSRVLRDGVHGIVRPAGNSLFFPLRLPLIYPHRSPFPPSPSADQSRGGRRISNRFFERRPILPGWKS